MGQTCRVCGVQVPSGFTNCDGCYDKSSDAEAEVKPVSKTEILETTLYGTSQTP